MISFLNDTVVYFNQYGVYFYQSAKKVAIS